MARLRLGVLISGSGTNLQALIDDSARPDAQTVIASVISNRADAFGLTRARDAGLPTRVIDHRGYASRDAFDVAVSATLEADSVDLICLAGFMRILGTPFVERWRDRLINIHPSLLPAFKGLDTHARAIESGVRFAGCTVHFVRTDVDVGPIIAQAAVPVQPGETAETLAASVLREEHRCYPLAVRLIAAGRVSIENERVTIRGCGAPSRASINPQPERLPAPGVSREKVDWCARRPAW
jgi:phosphoribosylglycinamide formyltransferase-1